MEGAKSNSIDLKKRTSSTTPYILKGEFFKILIQNGESVTVQCRKCPEKNIYKGSVKSTGNFHMHIKRKHPDALPRLQELKLKSFMERKLKVPEKTKNILRAKYSKEKLEVASNSAPPVLLPSSDSITKPYDNKVVNTEPLNCCKKTEVPEKTIWNSLNLVYDQKPLLNNNTTANVYQPPPPPAHYNQAVTDGTCKNNVVLNPATKEIKQVGYQNCYITQQPNQTATAANTTNNGQGYTLMQQNGNVNLPVSTPLTAAASMIFNPAQDVLNRIDNHLKGIERQMYLRNQIETNRIYLDLAKFKYLNPNFAFQG